MSPLQAPRTHASACTRPGYCLPSLRGLIGLAHLQLFGQHRRCVKACLPAAVKCSTFFLRPISLLQIGDMFPDLPLVQTRTLAQKLVALRICSHSIAHISAVQRPAL